MDVAVIKQGWDEVPTLFFSVGIGVVAGVCMVYRVAHTPPGGHITRFKERYMGDRDLDRLMTGISRDLIEKFISLTLVSYQMGGSMFRSMGCGTGRSPTSVPCCKNLRISFSSVIPLSIHIFSTCGTRT
ncbi:unnamed protein product [Medioppia subpectinata]|uniref:Uncharacterized protein n=1 Tax=Medioppia subpectinata TaxID=1979941 RepID=A0A7R9L6I8_9ACAR|nr:unnamed protein product [Medioppia subpectinata]CAG2116274.1 unnamed protein product [Medioppia subpectinata]